LLDSLQHASPSLMPDGSYQRTAGVGMQDSSLSFNALYEQARQSRPLLERAGNTMLDTLRQAHPGVFEDAVFQMGPQKSIDRAQAKIAGDYGGDTSQISDLTRGRIVVHSPEQIHAIRDYMAHGDKPLSVEKIKDRFAEPSDTNFRDINIKARLENGHVVELRVEHADVMAAADHTHVPYERVQDIDREAAKQGRMLSDAEALERQTILDQVRDTHGAPAQARGLDVLLNDKGRAKMAAQDAERVTPRPAPAATADITSHAAPAADDAAAKAAKTAGHVAPAEEEAAAAAAKTGGRSLLRAFGEAAAPVLEHAPVIGAALTIAAGAAETADSLAHSDYRGATQAAGATAGALGGGIAGAEAGAAGGAALGSVVPVVGTAAGALVGGLIGGITGGIIGAWGGGGAATDTYDAAKGISSAFSQAAPATAEQIGQQQQSLLHRSGLDTMEQNGKPLDMLSILRDPKKRADFVKTLEHSADTTNNADTKAALTSMVQTAKDVGSLEDKRQAALKAETPAPSTTPTVAPAAQAASMSWMANIAPVM
jgi:hypothetical protein